MDTLLAGVHVALLDDHPLFRQGLRHLLQELPYVETVTETAELSELLVVCRQRLPDVLLLDLQMPQHDGGEVAQVLIKEFPELKIIVLSMFAADKYITQMMKLGARSYLPKDANQAEIIHTLHEVLTTGYHLTPKISRAIVRGVQEPPQKRSVSLFDPVYLTPREREVLQLICRGLTNSNIGEKLFISTRTVEGYRQRLLEKTESSNIASLMVYAAKNGFIET